MAHELTDNGTRYTHYRELLDLWEQGLLYYEEHGVNTAADKKRREELDTATIMLSRQLDLLANFNVKRATLMRDINQATKINLSLEED